VLFVSTSNERIADAAVKIDGFRYNQPLEEINSGLAEHLASATAVSLGDSGAAAGLTAAEQHVEEAFGEAEHFVAESDVDFGVAASLQALKQEWLSLKADAPKLSYEASSARHDKLFDDLAEINEEAVDRARMMLVDDLDTYYLAHVASKGILATEQSIGHLVAALTTVTSTGQAGAEQRLQVGTYTHAMERNVEEIEDELHTAVASHTGSADLKSKIEPAVAELSGAVKAFAELIDAKVLTAAHIDLATKDVQASASKALEAIDSLHDVVQPSLVAFQVERIREQKVARAVQVGVIGALTLFAIFLAYTMTRLIVAPLRAAIDIFGRMAKGDFSTSISVRGADEPNQVLRALEGMQGTLRTQIESERAASAENSRIKSALDKAGSSVMLADQKLDVLYVNEAARRLFNEAQQDIRKAVPELDAGRLVGSNAGMLLRIVPDAANVLATLRDQYVADMQLGGRAMRVCANPVLTADGQRVGTILEWIDRTQEVKAEEEIGAVVRGALDGDLGRQVQTSGKTGFFATMAGGLNQLLGNMAQVISEMKAASQDVHRGAEEISAGNVDLSKRTEQQGSSLEETAASMEEMTSTVKQNADNASAANQLAAAARAHAEEGGAVVQNAVRAMEGINESSRRIADIIGVIDEIAFQTNLLALNAAVEAARAGEQGRGFAVVATEVRSLAGRSASAAKEIKSLIEESVGRVDEGSRLVTRSGETLEQIIGAVKKVSDVVAEIAAASREQSTGIDQVSRTVTQMDEMTQQNAALVEQAAAASQSMTERARRLSQAVERYRIGGEVQRAPGVGATGESAAGSRGGGRRAA
jgi:methyl-accepting chemotaxis protein